MVLPVNRPANEIAVTAQLADLSTESSCYVAAPCRGRLKRVFSCIANAITSADATWTVEINGTAVSGVSVDVTQSGSAAGDVDSVEVPYGPTSFVNEGDTIEFISDGDSSTTCVTNFTAVIEQGSD